MCSLFLSFCAYRNNHQCTVDIISIFKMLHLDENNPKNVLVKSLSLVIDGRPEVTMDLGGKLLHNVTVLLFCRRCTKESIFFNYRTKINKKWLCSTFSDTSELSKLYVSVKLLCSFVSIGIKVSVFVVIKPVMETPFWALKTLRNN